jgi:hypothetical protein
VADFELDLAGRGIPSYLADASVESSPVQHAMLHFEPLWLGSFDDPDTNTISLDSWVARHAPVDGADAGDLLLQMDIEDAEWATLTTTSDATLARFRIIVIEFHDLESLVSRKGFDYMGLVFRRLNRLFSVVHIHPNNSRPVEVLNGVPIHPVIEFTLLRRDRITREEPAIKCPHPLDARNVLNSPNVVLRRAWFAQPPR